jgi:hypothetical protein
MSEGLTQYMTNADVPSGQMAPVADSRLTKLVSNNARTAGIIIIVLVVLIFVIIIALHGIGKFGPFIKPAGKKDAKVDPVTKPAPPDAETESLIDAINKA